MESRATFALMQACPYLRRVHGTTTAAAAILPLKGLRSLSTSAKAEAACGKCPVYHGQSSLLSKASQCPVMGAVYHKPEMTSDAVTSTAATAEPSSQCKDQFKCPYGKCPERKCNLFDILYLESLSI